MILELLTKGATEQEILENFPKLDSDNLRAVLRYAHYMAAGKIVFNRVIA